MALQGFDGAIRAAMSVWVHTAPSLVSIAIGVYFILGTAQIIDWLFKNE
jgi:hypothetical protein